MKVWPLAAVAIVVGFCTSCGGRRDRELAPYLPLAAVESTYGPLITAGNHPTADQHGTGERVGLFRDASGTVWGLPLAFEDDAAVLACAPPELQGATVTGSLEAGASVIGSTNRPTGWRGGTGELELLLRDRNGALRRQAVQGAEMPEPACWAADSPGPRRPLHYYRLAPGRLAAE